MQRYLGRRLLGMIPAVLLVLFLVMLVVDLIPGDPIVLMLGENAKQEQVDALRKFYGFDKPMPIRYVQYVGRLLRGDLGRSLRENRAVVETLRDVWPNTLKLTSAAFIIAAIVGVVAGVISAARPYGLVDNIIRVASFFGLSMPVFWTGLTLIYWLSFRLRWFPVGGTGSWRHVVLPALTLAGPSIAILARMTRSSVLEIMGEDYIRTARAKGLPERSVMFKHALRSALIPLVTVMGLQCGQMLGGSILTETVFGWTGLGRLATQAIFARDYVLLQGAILVMALSFMLINLVVDVSYALLDPRTRYS